jgi:hypothetical protein
VLADQPDSADAHDLIGRILVEQCDFEGALREYRAAASLTPGCLLRGQHAGALAFYQGANSEALERLEHTLGLGVQSKLFDALSLVLIALLRFDAGDEAGVLRHAPAIEPVSAAFSGVRAPAAAGTGCAAVGGPATRRTRSCRCRPGPVIVAGWIR